jgi:hypothetical protein
VKLGGSAIKIAYLAFPLFGLTFIELFFDYRLFDFYYLGEISWGLAIAGFFGAYWYSVFEKA